MNKSFFTILKLSVCVLLFFILSNESYAASTFTVTPRVIDLTAESRDLMYETIVITNTSNHVVNVFPSVNEITLEDGGDISEFRGPTMVDRPVSITSWLEITRAPQMLQPSEERELTLTVRMNPNTAPGEYHALLGFGYGKNRPIAEAKVAASQAPAIVVTIRVPDTTVEFADLDGFMIDKFVTSDDNNAVRYTLENPGDTTITPMGEVIIYDTNGKELLSIDANPERTSLAPGERKEISQSLPTDGLMGRHKGFLNVKYGSQQTASVYDTAFFYVVPLRLLLIIFGIILVIAIVLSLYLHRRYEIGASADDDGVHHLGLHIKDSTSNDQDHDINLKSN